MAIVVIGGSAGALDPLRKILAALPKDFPGTIFVVLHTAAGAPSVLPAILSRAGALPASVARDGAPFKTGHIYVAAPDHHLTVHQGCMRVMRGPRENRHRPAIDALFRSAARAYGPRVIAALLSGLLDDGALGLQLVTHHGGKALVQTPSEAAYGDMPRAAIAQDRPEVLDFDQIASAIVRYAAEVNSLAEPEERTDREVEAAEFDLDSLEDDNGRGKPAQYVCPECKGPLWEKGSGTTLHYRCRVGHAYSADSLFAANTDELEGALWAAIRALEENAAMSRKMAKRATTWRHDQAAARLVEHAQSKEHQARLLSDMLLKSDTSNSLLAGTGTEG